MNNLKVEENSENVQSESSVADLSSSRSLLSVSGNAVMKAKEMYLRDKSSCFTNCSKTRHHKAKKMPLNGWEKKKRASIGYNSTNSYVFLILVLFFFAGPFYLA